MRDEKGDEALGRLSTMAMSQLVDYFSVAVSQNTPATVVPIITKHDAGKDTAEVLSLTQASITEALGLGD
jgi:hypothetical protein